MYLIPFSQVQTILEQMEENFTAMNDKIMAQIGQMDTRQVSNTENTENYINPLWYFVMRSLYYLYFFTIFTSLLSRLENVEQTVSELILKSGIDPSTL